MSIGFAQRGYMGTGDAFTISLHETLDHRSTQIASIPQTDAQALAYPQQAGVVEEGITAEQSVLKKNRPRIILREAAAPPMKMQPVLMGLHQATSLHPDSGARRKRNALDKHRNAIGGRHGSPA